MITMKNVRTWISMVSLNKINDYIKEDRKSSPILMKIPKNPLNVSNVKLLSKMFSNIFGFFMPFW